MIFQRAALQAYYFICLGFAAIVLSCLKVATNGTNNPLPAGHDKALGHHRPPEENVEHWHYFPSPVEFHEKFVSKSKVVVFKGVCKDYPASVLWTDEYLRGKFGDVKVSVDQRKMENRYIPSDSIHLGEFLDIYNKSSAYLIDTLPKEMRNDVMMPDCLLCGGFTKRLQDVALWFSSGKSKSHLHYDTVENIYCMISGTKRWFLVDKENTENIIMDHKEGDYCSVDVDKVDMEKYPFLQHMPWYNVTVEKGDCVYVPYGWAHQVSSFHRNIAVNVWWTPMMVFNACDCQEARDKQTLSHFQFTPGEQYRFLLLKLLHDHDGRVNFTVINNNVLSEHDGQRLISLKEFEVLDTNKDGLVGEAEIQEISLDKLESMLDGIPAGEVNIRGEWMKSNEETHLNAEVSKKPATHEEL